jgi:hypothetical protein
MSEKLWKITGIKLTEDARRFGIKNVGYAYHVIGEYLPASGREGAFSWTIPAKDLESPQYDLSGVVLPAA